jgi:hypothetical protein
MHWHDSPGKRVAGVCYLGYKIRPQQSMAIEGLTASPDDLAEEPGSLNFPPPHAADCRHLKMLQSERIATLNGASEPGNTYILTNVFPEIHLIQKNFFTFRRTTLNMVSWNFFMWERTGMLLM